MSKARTRPCRLKDGLMCPVDGRIIIDGRCKGCSYIDAVLRDPRHAFDIQIASIERWKR